MALTVNQKAKLKITRQFVVVGVIIGLVYIAVEWGKSDIWHYFVGATIGFIVGLLIALLELYVFARGAKRLKFIWLLALRTLAYLVIIVAIIFMVVVVNRVILEDRDAGFEEVIRGEYIQEYLYEGRFLKAVLVVLTFAFSVNFVRMISRKMGQGMLISYIMGTYYAPVHQTRIFMFVNLVDSKKIVSELGSHGLHSFLNDLFYDLTVPIVRNSGIIYEYIEDLIVISWAMDKGLKNACCIRVFFDIQNTINVNKEKYLEKYGFVPNVQAGVHTGSVVRAEIGEVKTQIVFHGDTMNTTARILGKCSELKVGLLASDQLIRMVGLPRIYSNISVGEMELRGKQEAIKLFEIVDNQIDE